MLGVFPDDLFEGGQVPGVVHQPSAHARSEAALDAQRVFGLFQRQICAHGTLWLGRKCATTNGGLRGGENKTYDCCCCCSKGKNCSSASFTPNLDLGLGSWHPVAEAKPFVVFGFLEFGDFRFQIAEVGAFFGVLTLTHVQILLVFTNAAIELVQLVLRRSHLCLR